MTYATYKVLGLPMQRQSARRRLVVVAYAVLATFCAGSIVFARSAPGLYSWTLYATMAVAFFLFGGTGRYGLIKPFANRPPRPIDTGANPVMRLMRPDLPESTRDPAWLNDERELSRRDLAHYRAYQPISVLLIALLCLAAIANHPWPWISLPVLLNVSFGLALVATVMCLTLPAAIILWTEPDIDL